MKYIITKGMKFLRKYYIFIVIILGLAAISTLLPKNSRKIYDYSDFFKQHTAHSTNKTTMNPQGIQNSDQKLDHKTDVNQSNNISPKPSKTFIGSGNLPIHSDTYQNKLIIYRHYLLQVAKLTQNFYQNQSITSHIKQIEAIRLPVYIKDIINQLKEYDNKFLQQELTRESVLSVPLLKKIFTVEKDTLAIDAKADAYKFLEPQIHILIDFFFSEDFQQSFFEDMSF